jgi:soluble lytic murein transglycosylase
MLRFYGVMLIALALSVVGDTANATSKADRQKQAVSAVTSRPAQEWLRYYKGDSGASFAAVSRFMKANPDFPAQGRLRREAEMGMDLNMPDKDIIAWFTVNSPQTSKGMKLFAGALRRANLQSELKREVNKWWREATLTRSDQQEGYAAFKDIITRDAHEDRLRILLHRDQYTNGRALAETLGPGYSALAEARISLRSGKGNPNAAISRVPSSLQSDEGLLYDRLKFRRRADNNMGAIETLNMTPSSDRMYRSQDWGQERGIIVRRLFEEKRYAQAYKLAADHRIKEGAGFSNNEWMAGWLALEYLNEPWRAFEHFERLYHNVNTPISKSRAAYWAGLASERLNHSEIAKKWFSVGARYNTTFYGQLSSEKLGRPINVQYSGTGGNAKVRDGKLAQAARWLKANNHKSEASMFLNKMIEDAKTPADYVAVAEVANALSMRNVSIRAAQEAEKETGVSLVSLSFPKVEKYLTGIDFVEWALVHALIRQESRYDEDAISSAGARGLMQLMPATAKEVATKAGISHQLGWLTARPSHNVALGSRYLRDMLRRYDGNYAMALAAYNAGPARVDRWAREIGDPRDPKVDLINWIETIPIYETRNYVQRVLESTQVYRQILSANPGKPRGATHLSSFED